MTDLINATVHFIELHSAWTFPVMFITAFGESFMFLSLLFPGTTIMVAAGLLVPGGTVPLLPLLAGGILGAVLGDAVSWYLGKRYGGLLTRRWPISRHPALLRNGEAFILRYGSLSVFIGRFFGPLRAVIPLSAGMLGMPARPFWIANILSALVWGPALLLPGSLSVTAAYLLAIPERWRLAAGAGVVLLGVILLYVVGRLGWLRTLGRWMGLGKMEDKD